MKQRPCAFQSPGRPRFGSRPEKTLGETSNYCSTCSPQRSAGHWKHNPYPPGSGGLSETINPEEAMRRGQFGALRRRASQHADLVSRPRSRLQAARLRAVDKQSYRWKSRTVCIESCISNADQNSHSVSASEFPRTTASRPVSHSSGAVWLVDFVMLLGIPAPKATCELTQGSATSSFCVKHCEAQPETHRRTPDAQPSPAEAAGGRHRALNIRPEVH